MKIPAFSLSQLTKAGDKEIIPKIIMQINKDLQLSGNQYGIDQNCSAQLLVSDLRKIIENLLQTDFSGLLNLFYRIDVPESLLQKMMEETPEDLPQNLTLLILKKEWLKVWIRNKSL